MAHLVDVIVETDQTILQSFGVSEAHKLAGRMPAEDECITNLVTLSLEDTRLCFMEFSRRVIVRAICNAAVALVRLECLGCRMASCGQIPISDQHSICKKNPYELMQEPTYASFFTGFLFAGGPGGFLVDNRYYIQIAPYVNVNSLVEGEGLATWFPPTTILAVFLRKLEGYASFFSDQHPAAVKDLFLDVGTDIDSIMLFMYDVRCPVPTRALVVIADSEKEVNKGRQILTDVKTFEGVAAKDDTKLYRGVKRQRATRVYFAAREENGS